MQNWITEHGKPMLMTVSGIGGGTVSGWELVNHVTSVASMIGAIAGAFVAICSSVWWFHKFKK